MIYGVKSRDLEDDARRINFAKYLLFVAILTRRVCEP